jgi:3-hydroxy-9,10-secoandrosta-1,3,5(10)-triene-9,17-dione monooxygenase
MIRGITFYSDYVPYGAERTRPLARTLAERAPHAETNWNLPVETIQDFKAAGLVQLLIPRTCGGEQRSFSDLADVVIELATGCASSAWVLSLYALHSWLARFFPKEAQHELFLNQDYPLITVPAGTGSAADSKKGFSVSGRWNWATGVRHCNWLIVNAVADNGAIRRCFLIPIGEASIIDNWRACGMSATGSQDVLINNVFVPKYRSVEASALFTTDLAPEGEEHLTTIPFIMAHSLIAAAIPVGAALAALQHYQYVLQAEHWNYPGGETGLITSRIRFARQLGRFDAVWVLLRQALHAAESDDRESNWNVARRARARMAVSYIVAECRSIIRDILDTSGSRAHLLSADLQRIERDITVLSSHTLFNVDATTELYGCVAAGYEPTPNML